MKRIFPLLVILAGSYWVYKGVTVYRLWANHRLGGGFMPAFAGTMAIIFAILLLIQKEDPKAKAGERFKLKMLLPVGAMVLVIAGSYLVGLIISMVLFMYLWLNVYEKYSLGRSALTAVAAGFVIYMIFDHWLMLPFPKGMLNLV